MTAGHRFIGKRYDGGRSLLLLLGEEFPFVEKNSAAYPRGAIGSGPVDLSGSLAAILVSGGDRDTVVLPGNEAEVTAEALRKIVLHEHKLTPAQFAALPRKKQNHVQREVVRYLRRAQRQIRREHGVQPSRFTDFAPRGEIDEKKARLARGELHLSLREWARGELRLEHPQGSSFHHLLDYDDANCAGDETTLRETIAKYGEPQLFVVERDWARAFSGYDLSQGECPMPFAYCCFEFRISGVRVLAFIREEPGTGYFLFCVYGRGGVWVSDDFYYVIDGATMTPHLHSTHLGDNAKEFDRVVRLVWDEIRVATIMVDAQIAESATVPASRKLSERRVGEGKTPLRNHYVIDLKKRHRASGARTGTGHGGYRQRGHFRRGTWVHYDNPESGKVAYCNDGGFWLSRTWRPWHFAGDPDNVIEREYRL